jgi:hypothetical protein
VVLRVSNNTALHIRTSIISMLAKGPITQKFDHSLAVRSSDISDSFDECVRARGDAAESPHRVKHCSFECKHL